MNPVLLCRSGVMPDEELQASQRHFSVVGLRTFCKNRDCVVPRYSALPNYQELLLDLQQLNSSAISTLEQFERTAKLTEWYQVLEDLCLPAWWNVGYGTVPDCKDGYIVKGDTNSLKRLWSTHMYAKDRQALRDVQLRVMDDSLTCDQTLIIRPFIPLEVVELGVNGMIAANEWRFIFLHDFIIGEGFYWSWVESPPSDVPAEARKLAREANYRLECPFVCVDVARTQAGEWKVVEVNAGEQAGLNTIDPESFYRNMSKILY